MWLPPYIPPSSRGPNNSGPDEGPTTLWLAATIMGAFALCIVGIILLGASK